MTNKILNIEEPFIRMTWAPYSYFIVIAQHEDGFKEWLSNMLINVVCRQGTNNSPYLKFVFSGDPSSRCANANIWDMCPFIKKMTINRMFVEKNFKNITEFIVKMISEGYYTYIYLNQTYGQYNYIHQNLVYGYDSSRQVIYLADHFDNGRFSTKEISYTELELAYACELENISEFEVEQYEYIHLMQSMPYDFQFNFEVVKKLLNDYISSKNSIGIIDEIGDANKIKYNDNFTYGISYYKVLSDFMAHEIEKPTYAVDHRPFTFMVDSKEILTLLIEYLYRNNYINDSSFLEESRYILKFSNVILNLILKYNISRNLKLPERIKSKISELYEIELRFLHRLLENWTIA